jgi:murein DD-endopeptidase MepM/ murein hydrolase activator NlpD
MPDDGGGIYLSTDSVQRLNGDLFLQDAHSQIADAFHQQVTAALPDMFEQANAQQAQRQAEAAKAQADQEQAQREQAAQALEASVPDVVAQHFASLAPTGGTDSSSMQAPPASDSLTNPLAGAPAPPAPPASPDAAPQPTPATDATPDTASLPPTPTAPLVAPPVMQQSPAPVTPALPPTPTAPLSNPVSTQQPISIAPATPTTVGLSGGVSDARLTAPAVQTLSLIDQIGQQYVGADGARAAQAVGLTEGALTPRPDGKDVGDQGASFGPLQFFRDKGQLPAFAADMGMSQDDAGQYARQHPETAIEWALAPAGTNGWQNSGYLGNAIRAGQQAGLTGPDLATYAQQHGQVSVSPERAGQNWQALFGQGQDALSGIGSAVQSATKGVAGYVFPVVGYAGQVANHWGEVLGGSDLFAARGTPVQAMNGGKVLEAGWNSVGGNSVLIQGDDGNQYYYAHFDARPSVAVGDTVAAGTYLGPVGNTGDASGGATHLHIGIGPSILLGADKYGGTGGDFNAVGLLRNVLSGQGPAQANGTAAGPAALAPPTAEASAAGPPSASTTDQQPGSSWLDPLRGIGNAVQSGLSTAGNAVSGAASSASNAVQSGLSGLQGIFGSNTVAGSPGIPTAQQMTTPSDTLTNPTLQTAPLDMRVAPPPQPTVFDAAGQVIGAGASALGTATTPFRGVSDQFPSGGPLAGPGVGMERQLAGFDQLRATNPQYAALAAQRDALLAQQPANAAAAGGADVIARAAQIRDVEGQLRQIASQTDIPALAQQNPDIASYEQKGGLLQAAAAAPLVAGDAPLAMRALASVIDPSTGLPSVAGRATGAARWPAVAGAGHLAAPVDTAVASAADTPLSLTPLVAGGAQAAQVGVPFAAGVGGGAAAGGGAAYLGTDPNDPNRILKIAGGAAAGGIVGGGLGLAADSGALMGGVRNVRGVLDPSSNAPQPIRDALNTMDGTIREAQAQVEHGTLTGNLAPEEGTWLAQQALGDARAQFIQDVKNSPEGVMQAPARSQWPAGQLDLGLGAAAAPVTPPPAGWIPGGQLNMGLAGTYLSPDVATVVRNTLQQGTNIPVLQGLSAAQGVVKQVGLTGSTFHWVQEMLQGARLGVATAPGETLPMLGQAVVNSVNPGAYTAMRTSAEWAPWWEQASKAGATQLSGQLEGEAQDVMHGLSGVAIRSSIGAAGSGLGTYATETAQGTPQSQAVSDSFRNALFGAVAAGPLAEVLSPAIFERQIPTLKVMGFRAMVESGVSDQAAATMVNQTFGGQNLVRIARSPDVQAMVRAVTLAPDWWEGWGRNVASLVRPGEVGDAARKYAAATAISSVVSLEGLNKLFTGHFSDQNQPGHEFELEIPKSSVPGAPTDPNSGTMLHVDMLGPLKSIAQLATSGNVGQFAQGRESTATSAILNAGGALAGQPVTNSATQQPIVAKGSTPLQALGQAGLYEAGRVTPAGPSGVTQALTAGGPLTGIGAALSGMRISSESAKQEAGQQARSDDPSIGILNQAGINTPLVPKTIQISKAAAGYPSTSVDLTPAEQKAYEQARSQALKDLGINDYAAQPDFAGNPTAYRKDLAALLKQADQTAGSQIADSISSDTLDQRIQANAARVSGRGLTVASSNQHQSASNSAPLSLTPASQPTGNIAFPFGQPTKDGSPGVCQINAGGPDSACTPGSTLEGVDAAAVSQPGYAKTARDVSSAQKQAIYDAYGIPGHKTGDYEVDHLVPLALGGSNHSSNLWPQPAVTDQGGGQGFHQKDIVEVYLWQQVKSGQMALPDAQQAVAINWRDVYNGLSPQQRTAIAKSLSGMTPEEQAMVTN